MKTEINQNFNSLRTNVELLNHELKSDMKELRENVIEIDKSLENAWREVEESKSNMASVYEEIEALKEEINVLTEKLEHQRQRNIQLDQYSRRENIRLVNVNEEEGEDTAKLFIEALKDMNLYNEKMRFHAIHPFPVTTKQIRLQVEDHVQGDHQGI